MRFFPPPYPKSALTLSQCFAAPLALLLLLPLNAASPNDGPSDAVVDLRQQINNKDYDAAAVLSDSLLIQMRAGRDTLSRPYADVLALSARTHRHLKDYETALEQGESALLLMERVAPDDHLALAHILKTLGDCNYRIVQHDVAHLYYARGVRERLEQPDIIDQEFASLAYNAAVTTNEPESRISFLKQSLAIRKALYGPDSPDLVGTLDNLAEAYFSAGEFGEAKTYATVARDMALDHRDSDPFKYIEVTDTLIQIHSLLGESVVADSLLQELMSFEQTLLESGDPPGLQGKLTRALVLQGEIWARGESTPMRGVRSCGHEKSCLLPVKWTTNSWVLWSSSPAYSSTGSSSILKRRSTWRLPSCTGRGQTRHESRMAS